MSYYLLHTGENAELHQRATDRKTSRRKSLAALMGIQLVTKPHSTYEIDMRHDKAGNYRRSMEKSFQLKSALGKRIVLGPTLFWEMWM